MAAVFQHQEAVIGVGKEWIDRLKASACSEPLRRARLNLHHSDNDAVHEMLIALCRDSLVPPHRHSGKSESFHVVEGEVLVVIFDDHGSVIRRLHLGPVGSGRDFMYRQARPVWHTVIPLSEIVVVHETTKGPFVKSDSELAPWAPRDGEELRSYLERLK
jgi:cupin fold WbuC family metalloprotein